MDAIDKIRDTSSSHRRTFVVEVRDVMRRYRSWAGIATGADEIIIPEEGFKMEDIVASIKVDMNTVRNTILSFWQKVLSVSGWIYQKLKEAERRPRVIYPNLVTSNVVVHQLLAPCIAFVWAQ